ncbi:MAG: imidazolonepropionase [Candidatus Melainabacteria bacterium]
MTTTLLTRISQLVTVDDKRCNPENPLGVLADAALLIQDGRIDWVGPASQAPAADHTVDCTAQTILPGLIDAHTHPIFAGDRADEFEQRLNGVSYQAIAAQGGGILKTVNATRQATAETLHTLTRQRLLSMRAYGVTTVEAKSGYGLDWATEEKCLRVLKQLRSELADELSVMTTYMGAHDIPSEYRDNPDAYVTAICDEQLPAVADARLADFCDVFCETGYFDVAQSRRILETARRLGMKLKVHAEEFTTLGGAALAGELGAVSADHLLHVDDTGIAAMKAGGTVATLLPGTAFYLNVPYAPVRKILDAGVPVALATDFNPGSCMIANLQLIMHLACLQMRMTPADIIRAVTVNAARALGLGDRGNITMGRRADLSVFATPGYSAIFYEVGVNHCTGVWVGGTFYANPSVMR